MAFQILKNCKIYIDAYDISGHSNSVELSHAAETLDKTTFGSSFKQRMPGLKNSEAKIDGFWEADASASANYKIDDIVNAALGVTGKLLTICPTDGLAGEVAFCVPSMIGEYQAGASVGEIMPFNFSGANTDVLARGIILENSEKTATGNGTARQLGAVSASQKVYVGLHVLAVSGTNPTLDIKIQSDDAQAFASPIDRITLVQANAIGSQWATPLSGAIADSWWRVACTLGGINPKFTIVVIVAIQ